MSHEEIQALRASLREAQAECARLATMIQDSLLGRQNAELRAEVAALKLREVTDAEWARIESDRATAARRAACPHLSIIAGTNECLTCGGYWNGRD